MKKIIIIFLLNFLIFSFTYSDFNSNLSKLEFQKDDSISKFVWKNVWFNDKNYIPKNLKKVSSEFISWKWELREEAKNALDNMWKEFFKKFWRKIEISSAYRSYNHQIMIEKNIPNCIKNNLCAKAWFSEHQTWLAIDIFWIVKNENHYKWLDENAYKFGFVQSYKKWDKIDWYQIEKWHWRFVGYDLAYELKEKNLTFTEYIYSNSEEKIVKNTWLNDFEKQEIQNIIKTVFEIKSKEEIEEIYNNFVKNKNNYWEKINYLIEEFKISYQMKKLLWN